MMLRLLKMSAIFFLTSGVVSSAYAQTAAPVPVPAPAGAKSITDNTQQELNVWGAIAWLVYHGGNAELDAKVNGLQRDYENGILTDTNLMHISRAFYNTDPALENKYDGWIAAFPQSYGARLARGLYFWNLAMEARGGNYINETSDKSISEMSARLKQALVDFRISEKLAAKPIVTLNAEMGIARMEGNSETAAKILAAADSVDSKNFIVRYSYLATLQTRWGGSLQKMQEYRNKAQKEGLSPTQLAAFDSLIVEERRWLAENSIHQ
jgi:hypothetical protein